MPEEIKYKSLHGRGLPVPSCVCDTCHQLRLDALEAEAVDKMLPPVLPKIPAFMDIRDRLYLAEPTGRKCNCPECEWNRELASRPQDYGTAFQSKECARAVTKDLNESTTGGYVPERESTGRPIDMKPVDWESVAANKLFNLRLEAAMLSLNPPAILISREDADRLHIKFITPEQFYKKPPRLGRRNWLRTYTLTEKVKRLFVRISDRIRGQAKRALRLLEQVFAAILLLFLAVGLYISFH
jgi:hypothetical protein